MKIFPKSTISSRCHGMTDISGNNTIFPIKTQLLRTHEVGPLSSSSKPDVSRQTLYNWKSEGYLLLDSQGKDHLPSTIKLGKIWTGCFNDLDSPLVLAPESRSGIQ